MPVLFAWRFTKITPEVPVVLERNPYYWKVDTAGNQLPYIDRVSTTCRRLRSPESARCAGDIDMQHRHILMENFSLFKENEETATTKFLLWKFGETSDSSSPSISAIRTR